MFPVPTAQHPVRNSCTKAVVQGTKEADSQRQRAPLSSWRQIPTHSARQNLTVPVVPHDVRQKSAFQQAFVWASLRTLAVLTCIGTAILNGGLSWQLEKRRNSGVLRDQVLFILRSLAQA